jgi:hypothetical protein
MEKHSDDQKFSPPAAVGKGGGRKGTATKWTDYINQSRASAEVRGIKFEINATYIEQLFAEQGGVCAISGLPLWVDRRNLNPTASLDRRDSARGYVPGNVQWVHKSVNIMKLHLHEDYFIGMCMKIAEHRGGEPLTQAQRHVLAGQPHTSKDRPKNPYPSSRGGVPASLRACNGFLG